MDAPPRYAVVMAGGRGERFWPLGRRIRPKQFLPLTGRESMLESTVQRLFPLFAPENVLVVTSAMYVGRARELLPLPPENVIGEPAGRDTAPCVALACGELLRRKAPMDAVMTVTPADHLISPAALFQRQLREAADFASRNDMLTTIGIVPTCPATGYGYIQVGGGVEPGFFRVDRFVEKPDAARAGEFLASGRYRWNSGIFIWKLGTVMAALEKFAPELHRFALDLGSSAEPEALLARRFPELPRTPVDRCIMEKADNSAVAEATFSWDDLGSWSALRDRLPADADGNRGSGRRVMLDSRDNLVFAADGHLVGAIGVHDLAIIHTPDATLVCPLEHDQRIKELLARLEKEADGEKFM